ncbi:hypothetical protein [Fervidibacter sp.]
MNWRAHLLMRRKFRAEARPSEKIRRLKSALSFFVTDYGLKSVAWIVFCCAIKNHSCHWL